MAGVYVGGKTPDSAEADLSQKANLVSEIRLSYGDQVYKIPAREMEAAIDYRTSIANAYNFDRWGNLIYNLYQRAIAPVRIINLGLEININEDLLDKTLSVIAEEVSQDPVYPSVTLANGKPEVNRGKPGSVLDKGALKNAIKQNLSFGKDETIPIIVNPIDPTLSDEEVQKLEVRAQNLLGKTLVLNSSQEVFTWKDDKIFNVLNPEKDYKKEAVEQEILAVASSLNREARNPVFIFDESRVKEFAPAQEGIRVDEGRTLEEIIKALTTLETSDAQTVEIEIPLETIPPKIKTGDVNNLGIKDLLGRGASNFRGSIANRVFNIGHASNKFKGILIPPGETFSFNEVLGDVSSLTGYKQAFVIKDGKTVLGDGGGVCQVSSTFFRAALAAGLPIIERRAHSYRVGYYEQGYPPGLDATVYAPTTDLKVLNDTPGHILIQPIFDPKASTLTFELYGTSDGRIAKTTKPLVTGVSSPPEDLYVDDPSLPTGTTKQIDFKAWGANVTFDYTVEREGEVIYQKTFVSNYRPWQAVFLRGTGNI